MVSAEVDTSCPSQVLQTKKQALFGFFLLLFRQKEFVLFRETNKMTIFLIIYVHTK